MMKMDRLTLLAWRSRTYGLLLKRSGRVGNPVGIAHGASVLTFRTALVATPLAVALGILITPWAFLGCVAPLGPFFLPEMRLRDEVAKRREGVERELPFFSVLVGVLGGAGVPLYSIFKDICDSGVFPSMRGEALLVRRDVEIFGMNPNDSLERLASTHPSKKFGMFLLGYTSKARSGGDVASYLTGESGELLRELQGAWARYTTRVGMVGSMMITVFGVVPLLLMVMGVFSPGFSIMGLAMFTGVGVPAFTVALLYLVGKMQPAPQEEPRGQPVRSLLVSAPFALTGLLVGIAWVSLAFVLLAFFVSYGISVRAQLADARSFDRDLALFLEDLLEYKRQDYDLSRAILAIEAHGSYGPPFRRAMARVAARLRAGIPLDEVKVECRSSLGRLSFLLLGEMSRSGGGTVDTVFQVSSFANKMIQMREDATSEMKPYLILSYLSPILLAFGVSFVGGILTSFGGHVHPALASASIGGSQIGAIPPGLSDVSDLLIVVSAASLGLIGAKIVDLTVKNTLRASFNIALAVAAVTLMTVLGSHSALGPFLR